MLTPARMTGLVLLTGTAFLVGYLSSHKLAETASSGSAHHVQYWACPMHPDYKSERPGDCVSCGMRLEPVRASGEIGASGQGTPGSVQVSAAAQQLAGVRTDVVQRTSGSRILRVPARIAIDESRLYRLVAATDGWIRELGPNPAGTFVKQNEVLASYYVRELVASQQNYIYAYLANAQTEKTQPSLVQQRNTTGYNLRLALDALRSMGITDQQIQELQQTQQPISEMRVYSPVAGFVLARNISPGQRFDKGIELYRIADIGRVWVMADLFEKDRESLVSGAVAAVRYRGRQFTSRMSDALPQFDGQSRTLKTRFELDNSGFVLRPDMFVDLEIEVNTAEAITVPADAVIDSGRQKTVYVERGSGWFEPRIVETGWRAGELVQITRGLDPGERIVVAGNFLIDSESRMKVPPATKAPGDVANAVPTKDPVCGMNVDVMASQVVQARHGAKTYTFCSENCKRQFETAPDKYVSKKEPAPERGMRGTE